MSNLSIPELLNLEQKQKDKEREEQASALPSVEEQAQREFDHEQALTRLRETQKGVSATDGDGIKFEDGSIGRLSSSNAYESQATIDRIQETDNMIKSGVFSYTGKDGKKKDIDIDQHYRNKRKLRKQRETIDRNNKWDIGTATNEDVAKHGARNTQELEDALRSGGVARTTGEQDRNGRDLYDVIMPDGSRFSDKSANDPKTNSDYYEKHNEANRVRIALNSARKQEKANMRSGIENDREVPSVFDDPVNWAINNIHNAAMSTDLGHTNEEINNDPVAKAQNAFMKLATGGANYIADTIGAASANKYANLVRDFSKEDIATGRSILNKLNRQRDLGETPEFTEKEMELIKRKPEKEESNIFKVGSQTYESEEYAYKKPALEEIMAGLEGKENSDEFKKKYVDPIKEVTNKNKDKEFKEYTKGQETQLLRELEKVNKSPTKNKTEYFVKRTQGIAESVFDNPQAAIGLALESFIPSAMNSVNSVGMVTGLVTTHAKSMETQIDAYEKKYGELPDKEVLDTQNKIAAAKAGLDVLGDKLLMEPLGKIFKGKKPDEIVNTIGKLTESKRKSVADRIINILPAAKKSGIETLGKAFGVTSVELISTGLMGVGRITAGAITEDIQESVTAALEAYGSNMQSGKSIEENMENIDWLDVSVQGRMGAAAGGVTAAPGNTLDVAKGVAGVAAATGIAGAAAIGKVASKVSLTKEAKEKSALANNTQKLSKSAAALAKAEKAEEELATKTAEIEANKQAAAKEIEKVTSELKDKPAKERLDHLLDSGFVEDNPNMSVNDRGELMSKALTDMGIELENKLVEGISDEDFSKAMEEYGRYEESTQRLLDASSSEIQNELTERAKADDVTKTTEGIGTVVTHGSKKDPEKSIKDLAKIAEASPENSPIRKIATLAQDYISKKTKFISGLKARSDKTEAIVAEEILGDGINSDGKLGVGAHINNISNFIGAKSETHAVRSLAKLEEFEATQLAKYADFADKIDAVADSIKSGNPKGEEVAQSFAKPFEIIPTEAGLRMAKSYFKRRMENEVAVVHAAANFGRQMVNEAFKDYNIPEGKELPNISLKSDPKFKIEYMQSEYSKLVTDSDTKQDVTPEPIPDTVPEVTEDVGMDSVPSGPDENNNTSDNAETGNMSIEEGHAVVENTKSIDTVKHHIRKLGNKLKNTSPVGQETTQAKINNWLVRNEKKGDLDGYKKQYNRLKDELKKQEEEKSNTDGSSGKPKPADKPADNKPDTEQNTAPEEHTEQSEESESNPEEDTTTVEDIMETLNRNGNDKLNEVNTAVNDLLALLPDSKAKHKLSLRVQKNAGSIGEQKSNLNKALELISALPTEDTNAEESTEGEVNEEPTEEVDAKEVAKKVHQTITDPVALTGNPDDALHDMSAGYINTGKPKPILDDNGDPVIDEEGNPVVEEKVSDEIARARAIKADEDILQISETGTSAFTKVENALNGLTKPLRDRVEQVSNTASTLLADLRNEKGNHYLADDSMNVLNTFRNAKTGKLPQVILDVVGTVAVNAQMGELQNSLYIWTDKDINNFLGKDEEARVDQKLKNILRDAGMLRKNVATNMGNEIMKALNIKLARNVDGVTQDKMAKAFGELALTAMADKDVKSVGLSSLERSEISGYFSSSYETDNANSEASIGFVKVTNGQMDDTGRAAAKEARKALSELMNVKDAYAFPSDTKPEKPKKTRRLGKRLTQASKSMMEGVNKAEQTAYVPKKAAMTLYNKLSEKAILKFRGYVENIEELHVSNRDGAEGKNQALQRQYNNTKDYQNSREEGDWDSPFYLEQDVYQTTRTSVANKIVNPINDKMQRHVYGLVAYRNKVNLSETNGKSMNNFLRAVSVAMGEPETESAIQDFRDNIYDPDTNKWGDSETASTIKDAIAVINGSQGVNFTPDEEAKVIKAMELNQEDGLSLDGLSSLAAMIQAKENGETSYVSDIFQEVDGTSNGVISSTIQTAFKGMDMVRNVLRAGGIKSKGDTHRNTAHLKEQGVLDVYEQTAALSDQYVQEAKNDGTLTEEGYEAVKHFMGEFKVSETTEEDRSSGVDVRITKDGRKLGKSILFVNYGAGALSIMEGIRDTFIQNMYDNMQDVQNTADKAEQNRKAHQMLRNVNASIELGNKIRKEKAEKANRRPPPPVKPIPSNRFKDANGDLNFNEFTFGKWEKVALEAAADVVVGKPITSAIDHLLNSMGVKETAVHINNAVAFSMAVFAQQFGNDVQTYLKESKRYPSQEILEEWEQQYIDMGIMPGFKHATSEGEHDSVSFYNQKRQGLSEKDGGKGQLKFSREIPVEKLTVVNDRLVRKSESTKSRSFTAETKVIDPSGGVLGMVLGAITVDGNINTMAQHGNDFIQNIYDALGAGVNDIGKYSEKANANFVKLHSEWSHMDSIMEKYNRSLEYHKSMDQADKDAIEKILFPTEIVTNGKSVKTKGTIRDIDIDGSPVVEIINLDTLTSVLNRQKQRVSDFKKQITDNIVSSDQYALVGHDAKITEDSTPIEENQSNPDFLVGESKPKSEEKPKETPVPPPTNKPREDQMSDGVVLKSGQVKKGAEEVRRFKDIKRVSGLLQHVVDDPDSNAFEKKLATTLMKHFKKRKDIAVFHIASKTEKREDGVIRQTEAVGAASYRFKRGGTVREATKLTLRNTSETVTVAHVILHEVAHAALFEMLDTNAAFKNEMEFLYRYAKQYAENNPNDVRPTQYGFTNLDEFLAEVLTRDGFKESLAKIPDPRVRRKGTLLDSFVRLVRTSLGLKEDQVTSILDSSNLAINSVLDLETNSKDTKNKMSKEASSKKTANDAVAKAVAILNPYKGYGAPTVETMNEAIGVLEKSKADNSAKDLILQSLRQEVELVKNSPDGQGSSSFNDDIKELAELDTHGSTASNEYLDIDDFVNEPVKEITPESIGEIFDEMQEMGNKKDSAEHTEYLRDMMTNVLGKVIASAKNIELKQRTQGNESQGKAVKDGSQIFLQHAANSVSKGPRMSSAEVYAHETSHVIWDWGIKNNPRISGKLQRMHKAALRELTRMSRDKSNPINNPYEIFLNKDADGKPIFLVNEEQERKAAQEMFKHAFNGPNYMREFAVHLQTNEALRNAVGHVVTKEGKEKPKGILETIKHVFAEIAEAFQVGIETKSDIGTEINDMALAIAKVTDKNQAAGIKRRALVALLDSKIAKELKERVIKPYAAFARKQIKRKQKSWVSDAVVAALIPAYLFDEEYKRHINKVVAGTKFFNKSSPIYKLMTELRGVTPFTAIWAKLLRHEKVQDAAALRNALTTQRALQEAFYKKDMDENDWRGLNNGLLKTDLSTLAVKYSSDQLIDMMRKSKELNKHTDAVIKEIKKKFGTNANHYIKQAEGLGHYMAQGSVGASMTMMNAYNIANLHAVTNVSARPKIIGDVEQAEKLIEELASLYAVKHTSADSKAITANLIESEYKANPEENGIIRMLDTHYTFKEHSLEANFKGDKTLVMKGYTIESPDTNVSIQIVDISKKKEMERNGYYLEGLVPRDENHTSDGSPAIFVSALGLEKDRQSGVTNIGSNRMKGTSIVASDTDVSNINAVRKKMREQEALKAKAQRDVLKDFGSDIQPLDFKKNYTVPVMSRDGVSDFRYLMKEETKQRLLKMDNQAHEVMGRMMASIGRKQARKSMDKSIVQQAYNDYNAYAKKDPNRFITISPKSKNPKHRELWAMMSKDMRQDIKEVWGTEELHLQEELLDMVFGYKKFSLLSAIRDTKSLAGVNMQELVPMINQLRKVSLVWEAAVKTAKTQIVIVTPDVFIGNFVSNWVTTMTTIGMGPVQSFKYQLEGLQELRKYTKIEGERDRLKFDIKTKAKLIGSERANKEKLVRLNADLENSPVHKLIREGVYATISDDVEKGDSPLTDALSATVPGVKEQVDKLSKNSGALKDIYENIMLKQNTGIGKEVYNLTAHGDFTARYAAYKHLTTEANVKPDDAIQQIMDAFVSYDEPTSKALQYLNDKGVFMFTKFLIRIQRVILRSIMEKPGSVMTSELAQAATVDISDIMGSVVSPSGVVNRVNLDPTNILEDTFGIPALRLIDGLVG